MKGEWGEARLCEAVRLGASCKHAGLIGALSLSLSRGGQDIRMCSHVPVLVPCTNNA